MKFIIALLLSCLLCYSNLALGQAVVCNPSSLASTWLLLGPKSDLVYNNIGRVTAIWVDSEDNNYILAGTRGSGLWRTLDGGITWNNLTGYQLPATGIYSIDVKKVGVNRSIYCSTLFNGSSMNLHGLGLIYSALSDYFSLLNQIKSEGNLDSLTLDEKSSLSSLSSKGSRAGIAAINLLGMQGEAIVDEIIDSIYETPFFKQLLQNTITTNKKFEIFPNPAHDACYLTIYNATEAGPYNLSITNVLGNVVFTTSTNAYNNNIVLPLSELLPGIYFIDVKSNNFTLGSEKLIIY